MESENKKLKTFIQGDLVFRELESVPNGVHRKAKRGNLYVEGETAGHAHTMQDIALLKDYSGALGLRDGTEAQIAVLDEPRQLEHPQHEAVEVPKGVYGVYRVRDWANRVGD